MPTALGIISSAFVPVTGTDVLMEPFNNLTAWTTGTGGSIVAGGRTGNAVEFTAFSGADRSYTIPPANESDTVTVGFAFRAAAVSGGEYVIVGLRSDAGATDHNRLSINSTGQLIFYRFSTGFTPLSPAGTITANTWYYIEMQTKLHDAAGSFEVRVNGNPAIGQTNVDTRNAGTKAVYDTIRLVPSGFNGQIVRFDDMYITTGAGAPFKGSITIP